MSLLDGSASAELDTFLKEEEDLEYLGKVQTHPQHYGSTHPLHVAPSTCVSGVGQQLVGAVQTTSFSSDGGLVSSKLYCSFDDLRTHKTCSHLYHS